MEWTGSMAWPGVHGMEYSMALGHGTYKDWRALHMVYGMACWVWNALCYGLVGIPWYIVWPGQHGIVYVMVWQAEHGRGFDLAGMQYCMADGHGMI